MESFEAAFPRPRGAARLRQLAREVALTVGSRMPLARDRAPCLRAIYCHYVFDDQAQLFDRLIGELSRMGRFVDTATVVRIAKGEAAVEENLFHLSFDDGFRNVAKNALAVLQAHGVPAIFFVPTSFVRDETAPGPAGDSLRNGVDMVSWRELEAALRAGLEVGSHTRTHARFSAISGSPAALEDEICGSKADIERRLGSCRYISWPYGRLGDADESSLQAVRRAGYEACFGAFRGRVIAGGTDLFRIPRHHVEVNWPLGHVRFFAGGAMERAPA